MDWVIQELNNQIIKDLKELIEKEMEKQIFKVGDKVFHYSYGWGEIIELLGIDNDLKIRFKEQTYAFIGYDYISFTEYTLQGFSQERPIELPEVGELCLVRDVDTQGWQVREFSHFLNGRYYTRDYRRIECSWRQLKRIKILD